MAHYYFTSSALPSLKLGEKPALSFLEFKALLKCNLSDRDYGKTVIIRRLVDIENLRTLWKGEKHFDPRGNYTSKQLEEVLITEQGLAPYIFEFIESYPDIEQRVKNFSVLVARFFSYEIAENEGFLKSYLIFEREWRLVLLGFRAKNLGRDVVKELQHEDPDDDLVAQIIAQKDAKTYEPPSGYEDLKKIFYSENEDPLSFHKALCRYRFDRVEGMLLHDMFSIERIIGYMAQLIIVERWDELDAERGMSMVNTIVKATT